MKPLNILERIANWLDDKFYFNCKKGRHRWGYTLSEVGKVYLDDNDVPKSAWHCTDCGERKYKEPTCPRATNTGHFSPTNYPNCGLCGACGYCGEKHNYYRCPKRNLLPTSDSDRLLSN